MTMSTPRTPSPVQITQARHPRRATLRSSVQFMIGLAAIWGSVVELAGLDPTLPVIAPSIAAAAAVTRVMASPVVEAFLRRHKLTSWLAAAPPSN